MKRLYQRVRSTMDPKIEGIVVGNGFIQWPNNPHYEGDQEAVWVLIVKVGETPGSNSDPKHSLVCKVLRADRVEYLDDTEQTRG